MKTEHQTQLSGLPRKQDNNLFAWMCTYTPEELIVAAKLRPFRLYGSTNLNKADGYFPINFCPYLKANLSQLLAHEKNFKGVVIADSCDGARRLYDTIGSYLPHLPRFLLNVPRTVNSDSINFFEYNLNQFKDMLQKLSGSTISSQELILAIGQINKKKNYLKGLKQAYADNRISLIDYYRLVRISATSSPELFNSEIDKLLKRLPEKKDLPVGPRVMVVGNFINEDRLWEILSELDCHMVYDDICTLSRYFNHEVTSYRQNPVHALAVSYLQKPSCMRMADLGLKLENLKQAIKDYRIQALIFVSLKFCDNTLYFYPLARQNLGLPVLNLELEYNNFSEGQIKTRLEAFLEML